MIALSTPPPSLLPSQPLIPMASLNSLLNPENTQHRTQSVDPNMDRDRAHLDALTHSDSHSGSPSAEGEAESNERATSSEPAYYQSALLPRQAHPKHDNCPDALDCLPDTDGRPQHTLPVILRCAILGSPKQRLTIREIYAAMEKKYSYYTTAGPAWKQSVRHHLSLNRLFERQPRPATEPGFGSYWTVNLLAPPGTKRPRKRGGRKKAPNGEPLTPALPKKPEHPQRLKDRLRELQSAARDTEPLAAAPPSSSTGTLRPVDAHSFSTSAIRSGRTYEDADDDDLTLDDGQAGTEDEYESEDDLPYQYDNPHSHPPPPPSPPRYRDHPGYRDPPDHRSHSSHSAHSSPHSSYVMHPEPSDPASSSRMPYPAQFHPSRYQPYPRPILHGAFSAPHYGGATGSPGPAESTEVRLERMQKEIDALKRQSSDAAQTSMRISDQLSEAQAEASRSKASLRVVESRLEDERRRRVEAEMAADEESRIRRSVEDKLRSYQLQHQSQARSYPLAPKPSSRSHMPPPSPS